MESRQIGWFAPECSENELARMDLLDADGYMKKGKEGADNATGRLDNVDWCNHARAVGLCGLSMYV